MEVDIAVEKEMALLGAPSLSRFVRQGGDFDLARPYIAKKSNTPPRRKERNKDGAPYR
jgi:hypothetical protein